MLVELVVAFAVLAVVAVAGYAQHRATEGARVKAGAEQLASLLRRVGEVAWSERTPCRVVFTRGTATVRIESWTDSTWVDAAAQVLPDYLRAGGLLPAGATVVWTTYASDVFMAHPLSLAATGQVAVSTTAGQVAVRSPGGAQLLVTTTSAGEVTVY